MFDTVGASIPLHAYAVLTVSIGSSEVPEPQPTEGASRILPEPSRSAGLRRDARSTSHMAMHAARLRRMRVEESSAPDAITRGTDLSRCSEFS